MCSFITVRATTSDGQPHPEMTETVEFEVPSDFTPEYPTCTCWIGLKEGDGKVLRQTFVEKVLQPFLEKVPYGNIIIEVR